MDDDWILPDHLWILCLSKEKESVRYNVWMLQVSLCSGIIMSKRFKRQIRGHWSMWNCLVHVPTEDLLFYLPEIFKWWNKRISFCSNREFLVSERTNNFFCGEGNVHDYADDCSGRRKEPRIYTVLIEPEDTTTQAATTTESVRISPYLLKAGYET